LNKLRVTSLIVFPPSTFVKVEIRIDSM
jgi:hypothetical protein